VFNAMALFPFYYWFGLIGPALAYLATITFTGAMFMGTVLRLYQIRLSELLPWAAMARVALGCLIATPLLYVAEPFDVHELLGGIAGGVLFGISYVAFIRLLGGQALSDLMARLFLRARRRPVERASV
jgi:hypothetical protein